jgi:hypothetical protein
MEKRLITCLWAYQVSWEFLLRCNRSHRPKPSEVIFVASCKDAGFKKEFIREALGLGERPSCCAPLRQVSLSLVQFSGTSRPCHSAKAQLPQTNVFCECFQKNILKEFRPIAFHKKIYSTMKGSGEC